MLASKTSIKDRFRQVADEANRIRDKHLFTLTPGDVTRPSEGVWAVLRSGLTPIEIENAKGRCPKTPAQRLTGDAFRGTPPVSAISPKKSLRTALKMGRS